MTRVVFIRALFVATTLLALNACTSHYVTTFTPEQQVPRTLDMTYQGPRANVAVGDFNVKARGSSLYIGDGLREMLATALFESNRFNVMDRLDTQGLAAEQQLSYSAMAAPGSPKLGAQMGVAELLVYGTVTEFEAEAVGGGVTAELPATWNSAAVQSATGDVSGKNAHMAIDVRVVDTATGRIVAARRIAGSAASGKATLGANIQSTISSNDIRYKIQTPASLSMFRNTPMELAIRDCIYRSVIYTTQAVPPQYFRH